MPQSTDGDRPRFSSRARWSAPKNRLALARERRRGEIFDLTESNPTRAGFDYPLEELASAMGRAARTPYSPDPYGLPSAREALSTELQCEADELVLTASTSEAYSFLFKLLCDAGDAVLSAVPSYPLIAEIAALDLVSVRHFALDLHGRWEVDAGRIRAALTDRVQAVVAVNPNNPTGSFLDAHDQAAIAACGLPVICDEVFLQYGLERRGTAFAGDDVLTFNLGGLSKSAGLPHYKLGRIRVRGPEPKRRQAIAALAVIADNFLSAATPVQAALPELLRIAPRIRAAIADRLQRNLRSLDAALAGVGSARRLPVEGGWSAVVRMPSTESDEAFALRLLEQSGVLVHPGYFFDFPSDGFFVVSLLTAPEVFDEGIRRVAGMIPR